MVFVKRKLAKRVQFPKSQSLWSLLMTSDTTFLDLFKIAKSWNISMLERSLPDFSRRQDFCAKIDNKNKCVKMVDKDSIKITYLLEMK